MKRNIYKTLFIFLFVLKTLPGLCTQHTISTTSSLRFSPDSVSAFVGDTINFIIGSIHTVVEVSQSTWMSGGNSSNGGFMYAPPSGMTVVNTAQIYYYVCGPHSGSGMKGRIFVNNSTGINTPEKVVQGLEVYPNPASSWINIKTTLQAGKENRLKIFNVIGNCLYQKENVPANGNLNIEGLPSGIYFVEIKSGEMLLEKKLIISR